MNRTLKSAVLLVAVIFSALNIAGAQQVDSTNLSKKQAKKWYHKMAWLQGAPLKPHKTINYQEFSRQYHSNKDYWQKTFAYLANTDLHAIARGKYPIDGENVYASVTIDSSKNFDKTNWESHRKYIDVQCIIDGVENMGVVPVPEATVTKPYDDKRDVANYSATGKIHTGNPGTFFIFFPGDAHRPNISPGGNKPVRKVVIKVKSAN